jgi:phospholipid/cholesterol/gamma-HCH transport system substrate-binding protein
MAVQETNFWKIGLFVVAGMTTAIVTLFWLGAQRLARDKVERVTYFDESVQGLDVGAPVKMRGVTIGTVTAITIAPDHRLVQVSSDVYVDVMVRLGLGTEEELMSYSAPPPPDLRVQLATTGITGVKFLLADFFHDSAPAPKLSFEPEAGYIPSTPSTLKSVEDSFFSLASSLPETLKALTALAGTLERQVATLDIPGLQGRAFELVEHVDGLVQRADRDLAGMNLHGLSRHLEGDLAAMREVVGKADSLLGRLGGEDGPIERVATDVSALARRVDSLVARLQTDVEDADLAGTAASLRAAIDAYGALASEGTLVAGNVDETLLLLRETLTTVQSLASYLERQPGALLRGRVEDPPKPKVRDR